MVTRKQHGFTIIEVVLVLAIAGLIFLMVFIALPALQKSQRDTQRRQDLSTFSAQINQFQANNKGATPTNGCTDTVVGSVAKFAKDYLASNWNDPSDGAAYNGKCKTTAATVAAPGDWYYQQNGKCSGETIVGGSGTRQYAVIMKLEGAGMACQDNQ